jgi:DNA repair photolyase
MRWDAQALDLEEVSTLPGMPTIRGLLRSVHVPEFPGLTFHEVRSRSALNRVPAESAMPFPWTINPYRGCSHSCVYCFARRTHEWLEFDSGQDFDTQIVVKTNLVDVLRKELGRPSWKREHVALGTNTDPYQRAEGRYRLMPGVIEALAGSGTPFSILTKGTLLRRDIPVLTSAAAAVPVGMGISMAIWDDGLHAALEPGVPSPRARLDLVKALTDAGLPCGVFLAPVLPLLTDTVEQLDAALGAIAAAGATGVTVIPLHLRPGAREWFLAWLRTAHPELVPRYERLYARRAYVPPEYRAWLQQRVAPLVAAHGLDRQSGGAARGAADAVSTGVPGDEEVGFPAGSLPNGGLPGGLPPRQAVAGEPGTSGPRPLPEQLSLL